ncbi:hypothetical protein B0J15DRAFT_581935 [Fusarium solani]|uniref:Uncharacterized protein n=1 Tax=Fusarium solani TaxID=169388 RepID=A0A9P9KER2_FUSSL|nr:uncharacterized protein B0J15DRAFT_581935 [Fusarium solani]KAH7259902.1 hypothetical protein B0J15DRAFT_581935 [Fusarium solani]
MSWDRYELGQKNIFYDEEIHLFDTVLPPHVGRVRRCMLDFSCPFRGHKDLFDAVSINGHIKRPSDGSDIDPALKAASNAFNKATSIVNGGYLEKKWENFFETHFFEPLSDSLSVSKDDSRRASRCNYYYDGVKRETNELWDLFKTNSTPGIGSFESLKCPKPDQAFYLPIYHSDSRIGIPTVVDREARQWNRHQETSIMEPFSWSTLKKLHEFGLQPTPVRIFQKPPMEANLKCYPWLIIEHKKEEEIEGRSGRVVCCQAANAAACAIRLVQDSAQYAVELPDHGHIPPIPVVTTIGPRVTVWLMYFAKNFDAPCSRRDTQEVMIKKRDKGYIMRTIWSGDMTKIVDVVRFQIILENTHTWAVRAFKPLISSYIEQWGHVHCRSSFDREATQSPWSEVMLRRHKTTERRRKVLPIVQALLEDHATMELDNTAHQKVTPLLLGLLMHQICSSEREFLSNEVDRVVREKLVALDLTQELPATRPSQIKATQAPIETELEQTSPVTQKPPIDNDDPNDSDYRESLATSSLGIPDQDATVAEASDAEASTAQSSDHEFSEETTTLRRHERFIATPRPRSSRGGRPSLKSRDSAPLSGSTITASAETTPTPNTSRGRTSTSSPCRCSGSPQRSQDFEKPSNDAPSGSPVFAGKPPLERRVWSPGRQFGQGHDPESSGIRENPKEKSVFNFNTGLSHSVIADSQESSDAF